MKISEIIFLGAVLLSVTTAANAQSGGDFTISRSVVAAGGASDLTGGAFTLGGTAGESGIGRSEQGGFGLRGGFWPFPPLAPTAATVSLGGRISTAGGAGIRNVRVTLTDSSGGSRTTLSGSFGMYRFPDVAVGETYVLTVSSNRYVFAISTQLVTVSEELTDLDFAAKGR
jgi:hypothetical protein